MTTGTLSFALRFAQLGMAVFPVSEVGKDGRCTCEVYRHTEECKRNHPHMWLDADEHCPNPGKCPRVRWREKSTVSELQIRRWWQRWPNANVGVDCGKSNIVVVDFDISKPDFDGGDLLDLLDKYPTWQVVTGSGGYHYIYKAPAGSQFTNAAGMLPKGCDIRAAGGFIVGAGSLHRSGNRYRFVDGFEPKSISLAELPESLKVILRDTTRRQPEPPQHAETKASYRQSVDSFIAARLDAERMAVRTAANGSRNERLNLAAWRLGKLVKPGKLTESQIESALLPEARACGLGEHEALRTIASGLRAGKAGVS